jgi:prevent-host-death family protein
MRKIGVRELRQNASEYLRLVQTGESFEVTDHGRPVAQLVPLRRPAKESVLERLIREGKVRPPQAEGSILDIVPFALPAGAKSPSEYLEEDRAGEN